MSTTDIDIDKANAMSTPNTDLSETKLSSTVTYVHDELDWGRKYRNLKASKPREPIPPKHSPVDVSFKLCRERQRREIMRRYNHTAASSRDLDDPFSENYTSHTEKQESKKNVPQSMDSKRRGSAQTRKRNGIFGYVEEMKNEKRPETAPSLLYRSTLSQKEYMKLLSCPNRTPPKKIKKKKCTRCLIEPCSPRILQMSIPLKRMILNTWKMHEDTLATERLEHFAQLLHTNQNIEPRLARCYFKRLEKMRKKKIRHKKRLKRKKLREKTRGEKQWIDTLVNGLAAAIVTYIKEEPLFSLSYKQMLLSDTILGTLDEQCVIKKPNRNSRDNGEKTIIEISDKISLWADTLLKFMDTKDVDSEGDISHLEVPSLLSMLGEEEEEGGEGLSEYSSEYSEFGEGEGELGEDFYNLLGELGGEDLDFLNELSEDILAKLIKILSNCSDEFLDQEVDPERWPGVTYRDILDKLIEIRDGLFAVDLAAKPFLEQIMIDWAVQNEPDNVDDKILDKINETSRMLQFWLNNLAGAVKSSKYDYNADLDNLLGQGEDGLALDELAGIDGDYKPTGLDVIDELEDGYGKAGFGDDGILEDFAAGSGNRVPYDGPAVVGPDGLKYTPSGRRIYDDGTVDSYGPGSRPSSGRVPYDGPAVIGADGLKYTPSGRRIYDDGTVDSYGPGSRPSSGRVPYDGPSIIGADGLKYTPSGRRIYDDGTVDSYQGRVSYEGPVVIGPDGLKYTPSGRRIYDDGTVDAYLTDEEKAKLKLDICHVDKPDKIAAHKPPATIEHSPELVCCLSLKIWAVWLLEITHNAHNWTTWISAVIYKVREFASIIRGDVLLPNGEKKVLHKEDWKKFTAEIEEMTVSWRQYSKHVRDLTDKIVSNFHGKKVGCCPKCLEDHLIKNVVTAHETLDALTEAMNCTGYWQRCLDEILEQTVKLTNLDIDKLAADAEAAAAEDTDDRASQISDDGSYEYEIVELYSSPRTQSPTCSTRPGSPMVRGSMPQQPPQSPCSCLGGRQQQMGQQKTGWNADTSDESDDVLFEFEEISPE